MLVMMTREQLGALGNEDLLGGERMAELRGQEIDKRLERLESNLSGSDAEALLGVRRRESALIPTETIVNIKEYRRYSLKYYG
jgi:hypothetical protein